MPRLLVVLRLFTDALPIEEFAQRRSRVMKAIGDGVAVVQGAAEVPAYRPFRQNNQFFYVTGVVEPRAMVMLDGRTKKKTLFLLPKDERREQRRHRLLAGRGQYRKRGDQKADPLAASVAHEEPA